MIFERFGLRLKAKTEPKSEKKTTLFFDAMVTTSYSAQVNGRHPFRVTYIAIHMIRSTILDLRHEATLQSEQGRQHRGKLHR